MKQGQYDGRRNEADLDFSDLDLQAFLPDQLASRGRLRCSVENSTSLSAACAASKSRETTGVHRRNGPKPQLVSEVWRFVLPPFVGHDAARPIGDDRGGVQVQSHGVAHVRPRILARLTRIENVPPRMFQLSYAKSVTPWRHNHVQDRSKQYHVVPSEGRAYRHIAFLNIHRCRNLRVSKLAQLQHRR